MSEQRDRAAGDAGAARRAVIELLRSRSQKARFITEVSASLRGKNFDAESFERALAQLEAEGVVMVRDHYCADPHLVGVDLRIVALVESPEGADPMASAIREIDKTWDKWLADYLTNHRCG